MKYGETDPAIRISAVTSLGRLRSDAALALLVAATEDPDYEVRETAYGILETWD